MKRCCGSSTYCTCTLWNSTGSILKWQLSTWRSMCRSVIVWRIFLVDSTPVNLWRRSWKPWKGSLLCSYRKKGRVTLLATIFLWMQIIIALMKIKTRSHQKLHIIVLMNRILFLWRFISWSTSLAISDALATSSMQAPNSQKERWWILHKHTDNRIIMRPPSSFGKP